MNPVVGVMEENWLSDQEHEIHVSPLVCRDRRSPRPDLSQPPDVFVGGRPGDYPIDKQSLMVHSLESIRPRAASARAPG